MCNLVIMAKGEEFEIFEHSFDIEDVFDEIKLIGCDLESNKRGEEPDAPLSDVTLFSFKRESSDKSQGQLLALQVDGVLGLESDLSSDFGGVKLFDSAFFDHNKEYL